MSSTRLPGKVLKPLLDEPMILRQIHRLQACEMIDELIVATSTDESDDVLDEALKSNGIKVSRGPLDDVLGRFILAAKPYSPSKVIRLTADCPLADPEVIDTVIKLSETTGAHYTSNCFPRTFPRGLDVEVLSWQALEEIHQLSLSSYQREHVTPYFYENKDKFVQANYTQPVDNSRHRWTVDTQEDFDFVETIYNNLGLSQSIFLQQDILDFLEKNPEFIHLDF